TALLVGLDRALRQARRDDRAAGDRGRGETARTDRRIVRQRDAGDALAVLGIDDRRDLPDPPDEGLAAADRRNLGGGTDRKDREVVLVDVGQQLHLAAARDREQRRAPGPDDLTHLDVAVEHQPGGG